MVKSLRKFNAVYFPDTNINKHDLEKILCKLTDDPFGIPFCCAAKAKPCLPAKSESTHHLYFRTHNDLFDLVFPPAVPLPDVSRHCPTHGCRFTARCDDRETEHFREITASGGIGDSGKPKIPKGTSLCLHFYYLSTVGKYTRNFRKKNNVFFPVFV